MKKVLVIAYYWPPAGGPGVQRWLKLCNYLVQQEVQPIVLTVNEDKATYPLLDKGLVEEVDPRIEVHKTTTSEWFGTYKKASGKEEVPFSGFANENEDPGIIQKLARFARGNFFIPDPRKGWNKHAVKAAEDLIILHGINTVITTSPPHSTQLIGLALKKKLPAIEWIADFRDPWTDIYYYHLFYPTKLARSYDAYLEKKVLEKSDKIISVTQHWKELYLKKTTNIQDQKIVVIPNGFDPSDFRGLEKTKDASSFVITYAGTITRQYPLSGLLHALEKIDFSVLLRFIGRWDGESQRELRNITNPGVSVEFIDYLPKRELNQYLVNTDVNLFIIPTAASNKGHVSGKLFDYMGAGNPIVGIGPVDGGAAEILTKTQSGKMFDYQSAEDIAAYIKEIFENRLEDRKESEVVKFSRPVQAEEIARLIK